jgi:hypothetical protein
MAFALQSIIARNNFRQLVFDAPKGIGLQKKTKKINSEGNHSIIPVKAQKSLTNVRALSTAKKVMESVNNALSALKGLF